MVDIKTAVENSIEFAKGSLGPTRTAGLRLEEVESSNSGGKDVWLITLSVVPDDGSMVTLLRASSHLLGADAAREYKTFTVAKDTGEVLSMKIRLLAAPN